VAAEWARLQRLSAETLFGELSDQQPDAQN
jgi:hypothetical protein